MSEIIICQDRHGNYHEVEKSQLKNRISVAGILKQNDKYVMIQTKGSDRWEFPGGGLEAGETITEALQREFVEETGLAIIIGKFITLRESFFLSDNSGQAYYTLRLFFEVLLSDDTAQPSKQMLKEPRKLTAETTNAVTYSVLKDLIS